MNSRGVGDSWLSRVVVTALVLGLAACSGGTDDRATTIQANDLAMLKRQVAAQGTRIAALETKVVLPPPLAMTPEPATSVPTLVPTLSPSTPRPASTLIPPVAGVVTEGVTKGAANAKVTITEYSDYL